VADAEEEDDDDGEEDADDDDDDEEDDDDDGEGDEGLALGVGCGLVEGAEPPIRGRSCCPPVNGALSDGAPRMSAAAATVASAIRPTPAATASGVRSTGRSPVFCDDCR